MKKKIISIITAFAIILNLLLLMNVSATNYDNVRAKINEIKQSYPVGSTFGISFNGAIQCKGFANYVFYNMFGRHLESYPEPDMWKLNNSGSSYRVGELTGSSINETNVRNLLMQARPGDILQTKRNTTWQGYYGYVSPHSMVVEFVSDWGVHVYEGNYPSNNRVNERDISYATFASTYDIGITLNRATNYDSLYPVSINLAVPSGWVSKSIYNYGENVKISWNPVENATSYSIALYGAAQGDVTNKIGAISGTSWSGVLPPDDYTAYVNAHTTSDFKASAGIKFKVEEPSTPKSIVYYNNRLYELFDYCISWDKAKKFCEDRGGHLVTITSLEENDAVGDLILKGDCPEYWIGYTDEAVEGQWKWITGEISSYSNWTINEPNNSNGNENYGAYRKTTNMWNDLAGSYAKVGFVCEIEDFETKEIRLNNNRYIMYDNCMSWSDAKKFCEARGGHLVTITSLEENNTVSELISTGKNDSYWIGYTDEAVEGQWKWITGETLSYTNWANGEPNNNDNEEDYASIKQSKYWNDLPKSTVNIGFVCEIEDYYKDEPTPTPTPTPPIKPTAEPSPMPYDGTVSVGRISASAGDEVTLPVIISNNPGISSFTLRLNFDKTKVTPVSVIKNSAMPGSLTSNIQQSDIDKTKLDYVTAVWANETNYTSDGALFEVKFKIAENVSDGEDIPISIKYSKGNIVNQDLTDVDLNLTDGNISVGKIIYGDIYGDGKVNNKDLVRLRQYLAEWNITLTENERKAADVFLDGVINNKDLVRLSQYLADWDVKLGE